MDKIYSPVENPGIIDLMIAPQPNHLAHQVAGIAADLRSNAPGSGPRAMLIALINTCLLRLFTRLETRLTLWQAGQLAPLPTRPASTAPRSQSPRAPGPRQTTSHRAKPSISAATQPSPAHQRRPRNPARSFVRAIPTPGIAFAIGGRAVPRRHLARASPYRRPHQPGTPPKRGGEAMSNLFRYKNNKVSQINLSNE